MKCCGPGVWVVFCQVGMSWSWMEWPRPCSCVFGTSKQRPGCRIAELLNCPLQDGGHSLPDSALVFGIRRPQKLNLSTTNRRVQCQHLLSWSSHSCQCFSYSCVVERRAERDTQRSPESREVFCREALRTRFGHDILKSCKDISPGANRFQEYSYLIST